MSSFQTRFCPSVVAPAVLIVEQRPGASLALSAHLRDAGTRPITVSSTSEAIAVLGSFHVDVVLTGFGMALHDALAFVRRIRTLADQRDVPAVIATSADSRAGDERTARIAGARIVAMGAGLDAIVEAVRAAIAGEIVALDRGGARSATSVIETGHPRTRRDPRAE
ncbi:response regulator [Sandaracinus amylolyticus]|uniref:Response regulatory domain-containing protein n=1 Tax=Sandaracinus amylolyticus TaxID=927083 RepID=A0A0F6W6E4_9BACT|nr:response regulator [Sandaracinus amylolyticus]AKF08662.1 hypothetical protein DB32_005811 [Sandaracinus amylolyticus]